MSRAHAEAGKNIKIVTGNSHMKEYWSKRYSIGGKIWGEVPSLSSKQAGVLFESNKVESVLVPGCGYGRHTEYFDRLGFDVDGIEIAHEAINIAKASNTQVKYYEGSVLDMPYSSKKYDAIYCFNVLHLFMSAQRDEFIKKCRESLKDGGLIYFTVFSELEDSYKKGVAVEENTFESKTGRPVHYFTYDDLLKSFKEFEILDCGLIDEEESHGDVEHHIHKLRYVYARKK